MRKKDILYFSKSCRFNDLDFSDKDNLVNKFKDRVYEFYLEPAKDLCEKEHAFAAGIICSSTIDFLAKMKYTNHASRNSPQNFKLFLEKDILLPKSSAKDFYKDFRCGLVHGGKIDKCGQFSFDFGELIKTISMEKDIMILNSALFNNHTRFERNTNLHLFEDRPLFFCDLRQSPFSANFDRPELCQFHKNLLDGTLIK